MSTSSRESINDWDEEGVSAWLSEIGLPQYQEKIKAHSISGDILAVLDHEGLKEIGIHSVGQRLSILKEVYHLKVAQGIPIEASDYVPPSEAAETAGLSLERVWEILTDQHERLRLLEEENKRLSDSLQLCLAELKNNANGTNKLSPPLQETSLRKQPSFKWARYDRAMTSPIGPTPDPPSPNVSPQALDQDALSNAQVSKPTKSHTLPTPSTSDKPARIHPAASSTTLNGSGSSTLKPSSKEGKDGPENQFKSFKVTLDDPCWKVLPAALKKYRINDDWQQYAMFICYGNTDRCLSYDEKPLLVFQRLKEAQKSPVFMLRHIKDIKSPIAVAQTKQAQRPPETNGVSKSERAPLGGNHTAENGAGPSNLPLYSRNTRLHQPPVLQPVTNQTTPLAATPAITTTGPGGADHELGDSSMVADTSQTKATDTEQSHSREGAVVSTTVSYGISIYPYVAEKDDEFDVQVDDTFIILSRTKGWWIVQRDPDGSGVVDESSPQGWVPAGCLLETNMPPLQAVAAARGTAIPEGATPPQAKAPILPQNVISTCYPGMTLMNYQVRGDHELELVKNETLRVFKRYNHWSYAIKEATGDRGWVPSWFIGKIQQSNGPHASSHSKEANGAAGDASHASTEGELTIAGAPPGYVAGAATPMSPAFNIVRSNANGGLVAS